MKRTTHPLPAPEPRHRNKSLAKSAEIAQPWVGRRRTVERPETPKNPTVSAIMKRVSDFIDAQGKDFTRKMLADEIDAPVPNITEWLAGWRSAPSSERLAQILLVMIRHDRTFLPWLKELATASKS